MTKVELTNGIRLDIEKEQEAIRLYVEQASKTSDPRARKVLTSIANEERVHVGELTKLLEILDGECRFMHEGMEEVEKDLHLKPEVHYRPTVKRMPKRKHRNQSIISLGRWISLL
jgi:rubrerythrin